MYSLHMSIAMSSVDIVSAVLGEEKKVKPL